MKTKTIATVLAERRGQRIEVLWLTSYLLFSTSFFLFKKYSLLNYYNILSFYFNKSIKVD